VILFICGLISVSPWSSGFIPRLFHVRFVVDKVAVRQVIHRVLRFSPLNHSTDDPRLFIYHIH